MSNYLNEIGLSEAAMKYVIDNIQTVRDYHFETVKDLRECVMEDFIKGAEWQSKSQSLPIEGYELGKLAELLATYGDYFYSYHGDLSKHEFKGNIDIAREWLKSNPEWQPNKPTPIDEDELVNLLIDAKNQIQYLHEKFKETGSGNAVISKLEQYTGKHKIK